MKNKRKILSYIVISLCLFINIIFVNFSFAENEGVADTSASTGESTRTVENFGLDDNVFGKIFPTGNLTAVAGKGINIFIGLSSTIMLIMVLWAGFDIMFYGGNAEKRKAATGRIVWTGVGIVIIISAYALSSFIMNQLKVLTKT